ncbi:hypothetical protein CIHG_06024 [Coccidioides immitis H538.4]|uniref:Uncharacterized protein n=1 Tax=Coccidioides immitis H538.4 TaxID=396776 RepID=A0A0J8RST9_COCIT|nr:hypothetical protein CIHG_06024 [Coccidioides immitis H538.4]
MASKYLFDSYGAQTYEHLKPIVENPATRPDLLLVDFFVDAAKDILYQFNVPLAMVFPQMPALMAPCSYIPGQPGFQIDGTLTSENASIWLRIRNELVLIHALPAIIRWRNWTNKMRHRAGVKYNLPVAPKPNYLVLINSFFGLEVPKDLPPLIAPVGPILADEYSPLTEPYESFLQNHPKTLYLALGTHIALSDTDTAKLVNGMLMAMKNGFINGVIWSVGNSGRRESQQNRVFTDSRTGSTISFGSLLKRMKHIVRVASRRKELGADLIEELIYDSEARWDGQKELRPMDLQTADMRMSAFKAKSWHLVLVYTVTFGVLSGVSWAVRSFTWANRGLTRAWVRSALGKLK